MQDCEASEVVTVQGPALAVREGVGEDTDPVDEPPDVAAAAGEELEDAQVDVVGVASGEVEPVRTIGADEEGEEEGDKLALGGRLDKVGLLLVGLHGDGHGCGLGGDGRRGGLRVLGFGGVGGCGSDIVNQRVCGSHLDL